MAEPASVVAWTADSVLSGTLTRDDLELLPVPSPGGLRDIRGCSGISNGWIAVSGVDGQTGTSVIRQVDPGGAGANTLVEAEYLFGCAAEPNGTPLAYVAASRGRAGADLHVLSLADGQQVRVLAGIVAPYSPPSWRSTGTILVEGTDGIVTETDLASDRVARLFRGAVPAAARRGNRIAYRIEDSLRLMSEDGTVSDISPAGRRWRYRGSMSWSSDGDMLLIGRAGGLTGDELYFGSLDVKTRRVTWLRTRYLRGLAYW